MSDTATNRLADLTFKRSADPSLRKAALAGDPSGFQKRLIRSLAKPMERFEKLFGTVSFTALWSDRLAVTDDDRRLCDLLHEASAASAAKKKRTRATHLQRLIAHFAEPRVTATLSGSPFAAVVAAELVLRFAEQWPAELLAEVYCELAGLSADLRDEDPLPETVDVGDSVRRLVAGGEVLLAVSLLQEPLQGARERRTNAIRTVSRAIDDATDNDGTLKADLARNAEEWLAPIVRVTGWAQAFKADWANQKTTRRWERTLEKAVLLLARDGLLTQMRMFDFDSNRSTAALTVLEHGVRLGGFSASSAEALLVRSLSVSPRKAKHSSAAFGPLEKQEACSHESDWAESALLRSGPQPDADVAALDWDQAEPNLHLAALGVEMIGGPWRGRTVVNGVEHQPAGIWVCTCWFVDREVAFAELESGSADGIRHVRHVMLSLLKNYCVITDTVTCPDEASDVELTVELPLAPAVEVESNTITRDLLLSRNGVSLRAVPAWLEDDRVYQASGDCRVEDERLILTARNRGGVTLPLVLDWHRKRIHRPADWNRLTVTEERKVQTPRDAAGFRVRIGDLQLMLYRSLRRGATLRAVMGHHTDNETVYARVRKSGEIAPLVMVESEA